MGINLVKETGSGVTGANTYATLGTVSAYCTNHGVTTWASLASEAQKAAILRAMNYMESRNWKGWKDNQYNSLEWPRAGVVDRNNYGIPSTDIPEQVKDALAEAAHREGDNANTMQKDLARGGKTKFEKIGPLETEYFSSASPSKTFEVIDGMLKGLLTSSASVKVKRT